MLYPDTARNCTYETKTVSKAENTMVSQTGRKEH